MAITLTQLRAFLAVTRAGGVHEAARHLYVSQPSVSAALAALQRELGVALVERRGRGIRLTAAGQSFAPYAAEVLGLLDQGRQAAHEAERPQLARIRVVAVNTAGEYLMPPILQAYRQQEPRAEVLLEIVNRRDPLPAVRVKGPYLAMVTIAFGFIVEHAAVEWRGLTGGQSGIMGIPQPAAFGTALGERGIALLAIGAAALSDGPLADRDESSASRASDTNGASATGSGSGGGEGAATVSGTPEAAESACG